MKRIALVVVAMVVLSGCYDALPPMFRVANYSGQTIIVEERAPDGGVRFAEKVEPGEVAQFAPRAEGCGSTAWAAKTESGEILAQISGGCKGHIWTIRGPTTPPTNDTRSGLAGL